MATSARKNAAEYEVEPYASLKDLLAGERGMQDLEYVLDLQVFDGKPLKDEPLAVLAARVGEDRASFLTALTGAGVESLSDRQAFTNGILRCVRLGKIGRGWAKPPPSECSHCGKLPGTGKKLLTCGRCKEAKYCSGACQKAHWGAGHKAACKPPAPTLVTDWAKVDELGGIDGYRKAEYMDKVGPGGNAGPPIYVDGHSAMINGVVKDIRESPRALERSSLHVPLTPATVESHRARDERTGPD